VGCLALWYWDARQTLEVFANTVYPGQRRVAGGGVSMARIFSGFLGIFMTEKNFPNIWSNIGEASNFFLLFPIPMMLMCWKWSAKKRVSALEISLAVYILIILVWQLWGFPKPVAQLTLFDRIPVTRALLPLGIASIIWTCFSLHQITKEKVVFSWRFRIIVSAGMLLFILLSCLYFNVVTDNFASAWQILFVCILVTMAALLFVSRKPLLFAGLILLPNIYFNGLINPIGMGLGPILDHPIYKRVNNIARLEEHSKWVVYGRAGQVVDLNAILACAAGAEVFNGFKYVPNLEALKELSSNARDVDIYNRNSFINLLPAAGSEISFYLSEPDSYTIRVNQGNDCWKRLGITHGLVPTQKGLDLLRYEPSFSAR
jgi:hypothetical protein